MIQDSLMAVRPGGVTTKKISAMKYHSFLYLSCIAVTCCDHDSRENAEIVSQIHYGVIIVSVGNLGEEVEFGCVTMPDLMNEIKGVCRDFNIKTDEHISSCGIVSIDVSSEKRISLTEAQKRFESGIYRDRIKLKIDQ